MDMNNGGRLPEGEEDAEWRRAKGENGDKGTGIKKYKLVGTQ